MGLLEKALEYKKELNREGKSTLIDTIMGPAETEIVNMNSSAETESIFDLDKMRKSVDEESDNLFALPEDDNYSPLDKLKEQKKENADDYPWMDDTNPDDTDISITPAGDMVNPMTSADEPVLPRDIDAAIEKESGLQASPGIIHKEKEESNPLAEEKDAGTLPIFNNDNDIPEIEPYIISEGDQHEGGYSENPPGTSADTASGIDNMDDTTGSISQPGDMDTDIKYQEHMTLYEIGKEISRSETKKTLFEVVLFAVMGQVATSTVSIMIKNPEKDRWVIVNSSGMKSGDKNISFDIGNRILTNIRKDIIDIESFKENPDYSANYQELASAGARLLFPWHYKGKTLGILSLGNKITGDEYTAEEKDFILSICEASAVELNKINNFENLKNETDISKTDLDFLHYLSNVQETIISQDNVKQAKDIIRSEFTRLGVADYTVMINNPAKDKYISAVSPSPEEEPKAIDALNPFISFIKGRNENPDIEGFTKLAIIREAFSEAEIHKMSVLRIFPLEIGGHLAGFTGVFSIRENTSDRGKKNEIDGNLRRFSGMIISSLINMTMIDPDENRYTDGMEIIYAKINAELRNAVRLNIPVSLILFSIKNFKRYGYVFGYAKSKELIDSFTGLIKNRISTTDFSARYDRNKILVVLPGKDKKFASSLANAIRNELLHGFKKTEMQILITFLTAEYPEDGDNLSSLIDKID